MRAAFGRNFSQSSGVSQHNYMLFCDGACSGNPGPGAWAFVVANSARVWEQSGFRSQTTNNQMELEALHQGLKWIYEHRDEFFSDQVTRDSPETTIQSYLPSHPSQAVFPTSAIPAGVTLAIYLDSQYVLKLINLWLPKWKAQGWVTQGGEPVKNRELIEQIDSLLQVFPCGMEWFYVPGHEGIVGNERVDELAVAAISQGALQLQKMREARPEGYDAKECSSNQVFDLIVHNQTHARGDYAYHLEEGLERTQDLKSLVFNDKKKRMKQEVFGAGSFPLYVAYWQGEWREFKDWPSCQAWVSGKSGVQYKKVKNPLEYAEFAKKYRREG